MPSRPNLPKPGDRPLPTKWRAVQTGVLVFQPTLADKVKIAAGYAIRVRVFQRFQHQPGQIDVRADWEVIPDQPKKDAPKIKMPDQEGGER